MLGAGKLADHCLVALNDLVYIIGGADENGTAVNTLWLYNPILHNYTALAPMPEPRYRFGAALLDGKSTFFCLQAHL